MKRPALVLSLIVGACLAGFGAGEVMQRSSWGQNRIGKLSGRGSFVASIRGTTYFERDLTDDAALTIILADKLHRSAPGKWFEHNDVEREVELLRDQFGNANAFAAAMLSSGLDESSLRAVINDDLAVRGWIEERIAPEIASTDEECRQAYRNNPGRWLQPKRYRASHLFVAAPEGTAPEVTAQKHSVAEGLAVRLLAGETFADLAREASEDEATKGRGGDLGYFSAKRMPPEFIAELEKLAVGQTSPPFQSHLGFHIVQLTETKPEHGLTSAEARAEIAPEIANQKRAAAVCQLEKTQRPGGSDR